MLSPHQNYYALCVGINAPDKHPEDKLDYAEADAIAVHQALLQLNVPKNNTKLLTGEDANLANILHFLNLYINKTIENNDLMIFYFAGHGEELLIDDGQQKSVFLATHEFDRPTFETDSWVRDKLGLSFDMLKTYFFTPEKGCSRRFFIFDTCHSGQFARVRGKSDEESKIDATKEVLSYIKESLQEKILKANPKQRFALASCLPDKNSIELPNLQHGVFTNYLLDALRGIGENAVSQDGWLTLDGLHKYISENLRKYQQIPLMCAPVVVGTCKLFYFEQLDHSKSNYSSSTKNEQVLINTRDLVSNNVSLLIQVMALCSKVKKATTEEQDKLREELKTSIMNLSEFYVHEKIDNNQKKDIETVIVMALSLLK